MFVAQGALGRVEIGVGCAPVHESTQRPFLYRLVQQASQYEQSVDRIRWIHVNPFENSPRFLVTVIESFDRWIGRSVRELMFTTAGTYCGTLGWSVYGIITLLWRCP